MHICRRTYPALGSMSGALAFFGPSALQAGANMQKDRTCAAPKRPHCLKSVRLFFDHLSVLLNNEWFMILCSPARFVSGCSMASRGG